MYFMAHKEKRERWEETVRTHTVRAPWLLGTETRQDLEMRRLEQMRSMAIYGIGDCSIIDLSEEEERRWFSFAKRKVSEDTMIRALLAMAIPKAYNAVIREGKDCTNYFMEEHNLRVARENIAWAQKILCMAREGEVLDIMNKEGKEDLLIMNTRLLKSWTGKNLTRVATIGFEDGHIEHAFVDFLPDVRIGDTVIIHRSIACEII